MAGVGGAARCVYFFPGAISSAGSLTESLSKLRKQCGCWLSFGDADSVHLRGPAGCFGMFLAEDPVLIRSPLNTLRSLQQAFRPSAHPCGQAAVLLSQDVVGSSWSHGKKAEWSPTVLGLGSGSDPDAQDLNISAYGHASARAAGL